MELRKGRHVVYRLHAHLIFLTKYRGKVFTVEHLVKLKEMFEGICNNHKAEITQFNGESDYVHFLIHYHPDCSLSKLTNALKARSSREMKRHFPELNQVAWRKNALWSPSYFVGSVGGAPIDVLRQYIEQHNKPY